MRDGRPVPLILRVRAAHRCVASVSREGSSTSGRLNTREWKGRHVHSRVLNSRVFSTPILLWSNSVRVKKAARSLTSSTPTFLTFPPLSPSPGKLAGYWKCGSGKAALSLPRFRGSRPAGDQSVAVVSALFRTASERAWLWCSTPAGTHATRTTTLPPL